MAEKAEIVVSAKDQTAAAFATAQRNLAGFRAQADSTLATLGKFAAGVGIIGLAASGITRALDPRPIIDYADQLNKLSQRTGIAVEDLSALDHAAKLADVSTEELGASLKKLNQNIAAAARGEKEQVEAFKALGVAVKDANGNVRSADQVLGDIADRFSGYADGANKVALANAAGGKSFEKLIPLLNGGRQGLQDARTEAEKLGILIGDKLAKDAERFNDNMTKLGAAATALKVSIASGLLKHLVALSDRFVQAAKDGNLLELSLTTLNTLLDPAAIGRKGGGLLADLLPPDQLKAAQEELEKTTAEVQRLQAELSANPDSKATLDELVRVEERARKAADQVAALQRQMAGEIDPRREKDRSPARKPEAPALPSAGAQSEAEALLRKQLEGRIKAIQDGLAIEADLFEFQNARLQDSLNDGVISIDEFYRRRSDLQAQFLVAQNKAFDTEITEREAFQKRLAKASEREEHGNQIADVLAKQSKAQREAGQAAEIAGIQQVRATKEFQRSLAELDAQITELSGDRFGAELIRNAQRLEQARRTLAAGGGDEARVQSLQRALQLQAQFGKLQEDVERASQRSQNAEEAFLIQAQRQGLSRADTEASILRIREGSIAQLDKLIAQAEELAGKTKDPSVLDYLEQLRLARERAFDAKDPGLLRFNELAVQGGQAVAASFTDAVLEGEKLSTVIEQLDKQLARLVFEDLVTKPLADNIANAVKGIGAQGQGGGAERLFSGIGNAISGLFGGTQATPAVQQQSQTQGQQQAFEAFLAKLTGTGAADAATSAAQTAAKGAETAATTAATGALTALAAAAQTAALAIGSKGTGEAAGAALEGFDLGVFFHGGGVVGSGGTYRPVSPAVWAGAERYHGGGIAGLSADEVPAILRRGEEVLTQADPRHRSNASAGGGAAPVTQNFYMQQPMERRSQSQLGATAAVALRRAQRVM